MSIDICCNDCIWKICFIVVNVLDIMESFSVYDSWEEYYMFTISNCCITCLIISATFCILVFKTLISCLFFNPLWSKVFFTKNFSTGPNVHPVVVNVLDIMESFSVYDSWEEYYMFTISNCCITCLIISATFCILVFKTLISCLFFNPLWSNFFYQKFLHRSKFFF